MEISRFTLINQSLLFLLLILHQIDDISTHSPPIESKWIKQHTTVKSWANKLGGELWHLGDFVTRRKDVQESFKTAEIVPKSGKRIIEPMAQELKYMFHQKISAVRRIMEYAQNTALSHEGAPVIQNTAYYNAKEMLQPGDPEPTNQTNVALDDRSIQIPFIPPLRIELKKNKRFFDTPVNTSMSSVHVPTNVFDRDNDTLWAIQWSKNLDAIFLSNYMEDPTLSWQFFGSATGFMRQFPASQWKDDNFEDPVDLYDCRLRSWYIEAANSPKDIIILVDVSGSMTGQRKDIARHVVYNILDTLGPNDFVNIFKFSEKVEAVVSCFNSTVQATLANIRELKMGLEEVKTDAIANYSSAIDVAFEALESSRDNDRASNCNQAIMLISDGVPYDFTAQIEKYNLKNDTFKPVRIFTYLIGKEVADVQKIKDMACSNRGYYVHLSTLAEVREQVLHYIPVMARPLVLGGDNHPIIWTQAYADKIDPQMTDYSWELQERSEQKKLFENYKQDKKFHGSAEETNRRQAEKERMSYEEDYGTGKYNLVTTVAMPVYDKRKNATYIANLLGVAGIDIPIKEIQKFLAPFQLGVNGYGFLVTNNGFILSHPDHRPVYRGILKPDYNSVDLAEVELIDDDSNPRDFSEDLITFRADIVNQTTGSRFLVVKQHIDNMKRVLRLTRWYYWQPIENTTFTLVIAIPKPYGLYRVKLKNEHDIHLLMNKGLNLTSLFVGNDWTIHPDWIYCRYNNGSDKTPEQELLFFLNKIKGGAWKWKDRTSHYSNASAGRKSSAYDKDSYYCDRELMQQLVFDAKATQWFSDKRKDDKSVEKGNEFNRRFGVKVVFLATQSGLTRWKYFDDKKSTDEEPGQRFNELHNRAIDEVWYMRAVEQHLVDQESFVFSVPYAVGDADNTLVTASHAIFVNEDVRSAPAAVVGHQFQHAALYNLFMNVTGKCDSCDNEMQCFVEDETARVTHCYILDNNGYVVVSPKKDETGSFFGDVHQWLMRRFVEEKIYQEVKIHNYQAVCEKPEKTDGNAGSILQGPIKHFLNIFKWFGRVLTWTFIHLTMITPAYSYPNYEEFGSYADASTSDPNDNPSDNSAEEKAKVDNSVIINRTRLQPCDKVISLYTLGAVGGESIYNEPANDCEKPFVVVPIPQSNLILVVFEARMCPVATTKPISIVPREYTYDNNGSLACYRVGNDNKLIRRRPSSCIRYHVNESSIDQCGRGYSISMSITLIAFLIIVQALL
ncbi:voltage-dependent calcium channel subunit alpha-2/delta-3 isoform X3 [Bradysia coprophila]|uniref:voltage-dependent calcium channel subunit alpha-2/delta-3 isoform X3 n=1 Tax=Bradysia coprophila TaxID=38358 RepID=UPI00187D7B69|nr:voltage-dependent calcium channel subunit alpha-2/delta-3 isoform X3 [Bradysia coprophila]